MTSLSVQTLVKWVKVRRQWTGKNCSFEDEPLTRYASCRIGKSLILLTTQFTVVYLVDQKWFTSAEMFWLLDEGFLDGAHPVQYHEVTVTTTNTLTHTDGSQTLNKSSDQNVSVAHLFFVSRWYQPTSCWRLERCSLRLSSIQCMHGDNALALNEADFGWTEFIGNCFQWSFQVTSISMTNVLLGQFQQYIALLGYTFWLVYHPLFDIHLLVHCVCNWLVKYIGWNGKKSFTW